MIFQKAYDTHILPTLIDLAMRGSMASRERARLIPSAAGVVLEIGSGSGLNLPYYGPQVEKLYSLEPHAKLKAKALPKVKHVPFPVEFLDLPGEKIPLPDASVDQIVSTWVLCSIAGVQAALAEMHRVLKPGGSLLFVEHGRAPSPKIAKWQDRLNPAWGHCSGGCNLNRRPDLLIAQAGFTLENMDQGYLDGPKFLTYHYTGIARKR